MRLESLSTPRVLFALALAVVLASPNVQAQAFKVVHNFTGGKDGADPLNGFTIDPTGILYGTASAGGAYGSGVVLKVNSKGGVSVLHAFRGGTKDGSGPQGFLLRDTAGNLYGTTAGGGTHGNGTVFRVAGTKETVLYSFGSQQSDGADPEAGLAIDQAGNLYGTTTAGGSSDNGTVFMLAPPSIPGGAWTETVLYSFGTGTDGAVPVGGVSLDSSGNLYGTASSGGRYGLGTVFQLIKGNPWTEKTVHDFQDANDGAVPYAGLIAGSSGNFYGAATEGGNQGGGTIFELTQSNGEWTFSVIYSVPGWGISGSFRDLVLDTAGNIYATTHCDGNNNAGTVYELLPSNGAWSYKLLYTFTGGSDGLYSFSNVAINGGVLYGTTKLGGTHGAGVVFKVTP
jgi:uncharacterized repeat protein (TIGR03803 family)